MIVRSVSFVVRELFASRIQRSRISASRSRLRRAALAQRFLLGGTSLLSGCEQAVKSPTVETRAAESSSTGSAEVVLSKSPPTADSLRVTALALVGPVLDSTHGAVVGIGTTGLESTQRRQRYRAEGSYRPVVHLILMVTGCEKEVRETARSIRMISVFANTHVHVFDARTGERLSDFPEEYPLHDVEPNHEAVIAPFSLWESTGLDKDIARSLAVFSVQLKKTPPIGTIVKLDLSELADALGNATCTGTSIDFPRLVVEVPLVDP